MTFPCSLRLLPALVLVGRVLAEAPDLPAPGTVPPSIDGIWRWTFTMPDGTTTYPKLTLITEDGKLTGATSFRPGNDAPITNAVVQGDQVSFQVFRERDDQVIVTTYTGRWVGKKLTGQIQSNWAGTNQTYAWEAERAHEGAEGIWKWKVSIRGRKIDMRVRLEQDGQLLEGSMPSLGRGGRRIPIKNGSIVNSEVYFEVERGTGPEKVLTVYRGKQTGETIKGTIETTAAGRTLKSEWHARRSE